MDDPTENKSIDKKTTSNVVIIKKERSDTNDIETPSDQVLSGAHAEASGEPGNDAMPNAQSTSAGVQPMLPKDLAMGYKLLGAHR